MSNKYTYVKVQALSAEPAVTSKGSEQYIVRLKVISGPAKYVGREVTEFMSISGKAAQYTNDKLRALGWKCKSPTDMEGIGDAIADAGFFMDSWEGKSQEKISVFASKPALDDKAKKTFGTAFRATIAKSKQIEITDDNRALERSELPEQREVEEESDAPF